MILEENPHQPGKIRDIWSVKIHIDIAGDQGTAHEDFNPLIAYRRLVAVGIGYGEVEPHHVRIGVVGRIRQDPGDWIY